MKKILAMILALTLVFSMGITVFADSTLTANGEEENPVKVTVVAAANVYQVELKWESLEFTYTLGAWDPATHTYADGAWSNDGEADITVINHSNAPVNVQATYTEDETVTGVTVTYPKDENPVALVSAAEVAYDAPTAVDKANAKVYTVKVTGDPKAVTANAITVGTITIEITGIPAGNP